MHRRSTDPLDDSRRVLIAIDDVQALFRQSAYRAPDYTLLQSYALSAPRLMLDFISGRKQLVRLRQSGCS